MKKFLIIILFLTSVGFVLASNFTSFREFKKFSKNRLETERLENKKVINEIEEKLNLDEIVSDDLKLELEQRNKTLMIIEREMLFKQYHVDPIAAILILLSSIGLIVVFFKKIFKVTGHTKDEIVSELEVDEETPRELYVDEYEFERQTEGGFKTKKEALAWLKSDPLLTCDYCGAKMRSSLTGRKEAVQLVTFYKKVPAGATDLRVVLGTYWYALPATELKCTGCERVVKR